MNAAIASIGAARRRSALQRALGAAIADALDADDVVEALVNEDGAIWFDRVGGGLERTGYTLSAVPCIVFDEDVWEAAPEEAKELGCSPDFNAWTGTVNPPPSCPSNPRLRTASGHLHIGWTNDADMGDIQHILNCQDLVKQLDWYLGAWSLKMDPDPTRRLLYGKAGACRYKPYGVEYRVLSNFWLTSKDRRLQVWNRLNQAIYDMRNMFMPDKAKNYNEFLVSAIGQSERNRMLETQFRFPLTTIDSNYR